VPAVSNFCCLIWPSTAEVRQRAHRPAAEGGRGYGRSGPLQQTAPAYNVAVRAFATPALHALLLP
jgi:hypothetical protein